MCHCHIYVLELKKRLSVIISHQSKKRKTFNFHHFCSEEHVEEELNLTGQLLPHNQPA